MADPKIQCPNCGKAYRWQTKIAGRSVRCGCQHKFRVPMTPDDDVMPDVSLPHPPPPKSNPATDPNAMGPDTYDLDLPEDACAATPPTPHREQKTHGGVCPSCNSALRPGAVICLNCGFNVAAGAKIQTVVDQPDPSAPDAGRAIGNSPVRAGTDEREDDLARAIRREEFYWPLGLVIGGLVLSVASIFLLPLTPGELTLSDSVTLVVIALIRDAVFWAMLVAGLFACAAVAGSAAGTLSVAMLKALAIAVLMGATADTGRLFLSTVTEGLGAFGLGAFLRIGAIYVVLWAASVKLFDFEALEAQILGAVAVGFPLAVLWLSPLPLGWVF